MPAYLVEQELEILLLAAEASLEDPLVKVDRYRRPERIVGIGRIKGRLILRRSVADVTAADERRVIVVDDVAKGAPVGEGDRKVFDLLNEMEQVKEMMVNLNYVVLA